VQARAIAERIPIAPMPDSPFLSGTFTFPFRSGVIGRWAASAIALLVLSGMFLGLFATDNLFVQLAYALGLTFGVMLCFSHLASSFLAIVNETAEGADEITIWAEGFKEWMAGLLHVGYIAAIAFSLAYGTGWLQLQATGKLGLWWPLVGLALFPFFLLSSLEADSPIVPFSRPIFASLQKNLGDWIKFYLLSCLLFGGWALLLPLEHEYPKLAKLLAGPLFATVVFVYARLLGRLAWKAAHT
jgi:hypothetical protein